MRPRHLGPGAPGPKCLAQWPGGVLRPTARTKARRNGRDECSGRRSAFGPSPQPNVGAGPRPKPSTQRRGRPSAQALGPTPARPSAPGPQPYLGAVPRSTPSAQRRTDLRPQHSRMVPPSFRKLAAVRGGDGLRVQLGHRSVVGEEAVDLLLDVRELRVNERARSVARLQRVCRP